MWYFPYGVDIEKESVNNARLEHFKDNIIESLAREVSQNSLDAAISSDLAVGINFELKGVNVSEIIHKNQLINDIIPKSEKTWKEDKNALKFLEKYKTNLNEKTIPVLKISDYNTTGLSGSKWKSLIENAGTSDKSSDSSAGSFGIGKAAPFAASDFRMVFYSTLTPQEGVKSIGVLKFISFDMDEEKIAQGVGYSGSDKKEPLTELIDLGFEKRTEVGTDIYIIGFNNTNNWEVSIKESMLSNFMLSIYNGDLVINIAGEEINKNNIEEHVLNLKDSRSNKITKNYFDTLISENRKEFPLDDRFKKYGFSPDDGRFMISSREDANRSVLMTRKAGAGMKIYDRKGISGSIQFNGIFQATGKEINKMLRSMENPNHDKWIPERYEEDPKKAENLNRDLFHFFKEKVTDSFKEELKEKVDAFGLSEFLPNKIKEINGNDKTVIRPIEKKDIKIIGQKNEYQEISTFSQVDGESALNDLVKKGVVDGDELDLYSEYDEGKSITQGDETLSPGSSKKVDKDSENIFNINRKQKTKDLSVNLLEKNSKSGEYLLAFEPNRTSKNVVFSFHVKGDNNHFYDQKILRATLNGNDLESKGNKFYVGKIGIHETYVFEIVIDQNERVSLGVDIYED